MKEVPTSDAISVNGAIDEVQVAPEPAATLLRLESRVVTVFLLHREGLWRDPL